MKNYKEQKYQKLETITGLPEMRRGLVWRK